MKYVQEVIYMSKPKYESEDSDYEIQVMLEDRTGNRRFIELDCGCDCGEPNGCREEK